MKQLILLISVLFCAGLAQAQDIIARNDSSKVQALVLEINPTQLTYRPFGYPDGPLITESKSQLAYVVFKKGLTERFPKEAPAAKAYDPNAYNLDRVPVAPYDPQARAKKREALYSHKHYVGFNYTALLNTAFGFHYMRDVKKAHLIIHVPFAVGIGTPLITNLVYGGGDDNDKTIRYEKMNYRLGLSPLFSPSMKSSVNFLIGPSYTFSEYRVTVSKTNPRTGVESGNTFELYRSHYGLNIGFLARITGRFNTCLLFNMGVRDDSYSKHDPYGINLSKYGSNASYALPGVNPTAAYVGLLWSMGYRF